MSHLQINLRAVATLSRNGALALIALLAGSLAGAGVAGIPLFIAGPLGFIFLLASIPVWIAGGLVLGVPVWCIFDRLRRTHREDAALAGFIASTLGTIACAFVFGSLWPVLVPVPFAGTFAGYIVHRVYYP